MAELRGYFAQHRIDYGGYTTGHPQLRKVSAKNEEMIMHHDSISIESPHFNTLSNFVKYIRHLILRVFDMFVTSLLLSKVTLALQSLFHLTWTLESAAHSVSYFSL